MANYTVVLSKRAERQLDKLPDSIAFVLLEAIANLRINPRPIGSKKLKSRPGYRIRVGVYRMIYELNDTILLVDIIELGHRKNIYGML